MRPAAALLALPLVLSGCGMQTWTATVGDSRELALEVAESGRDKERGLMGRDEVPVDTGMAFPYPEPRTGAFYMFDVDVPLTAVFSLGGRVVGVFDMEPCRAEDPDACPRYGPDEPFDLVIETAPETLDGLVEVGDLVRVER